jgi:Domain of unknown function (DUF4394)
MIVPRRSALAAMAVAAAVALPTAVAADDGSRPAGVNPATRSSDRLAVIGLTDQGRLVSFRSSDPDDTRNLGRVRGLQGDGWLIGIDYRVQDGNLYGVGDAGGIYTISPKRWRVSATKVSQLSVPLTGTSFGVDFNPAANRLRVISDTGQNLRHNIDDPLGAIGVTTVDGTLAYPGVPPAPPTTALGVTAAAYTNNDLDPNTATTLFDIDTSDLAQVVVQSPANAGLLAATGKLTVNPDVWAGFDIYSDVSDDANVSNRGFAVLDVDDRSRFYEVDLLTGAASRVGTFWRGTQVVDIAIPLGQS